MGDDYEGITSDVFLSATGYYSVPPGEPYTLLEKMFLMFDASVWIAIIVTFFIGFVTIQIINLLSRKVQNFVYGRDIQSPTMNLLNVFLCGGQFKVPRRNFARFLLVLFIVYSLIIRTCYQSTLFKLLQADVRKPEVKMIAELYDRGFTLYSKIPLRDPQEGEIMQVKFTNILSVFNNLFFISLRFEKCDFDIFECLEHCMEPENRRTTFIFPLMISLIHNNHYRSGFSSISFTKESVKPVFFTKLFRRFSPFFEEFNDKIRQIISSGLFEWYWKNNVDPKGIKRGDEEIGPEKLTLDHLSIGFQIFTICLALSVIVFLFELLTVKFIDRFAQLKFHETRRIPQMPVTSYKCPVIFGPKLYTYDRIQCFQE